MRNRNLWLMASLLTLGCASAPGYRPPQVEVPATFREITDTIIQAPAITKESSTVAALGVADTILARLIKEAVGANLDLRAAEARVRGARSARTEAVLDFAPTITFAGGYTRQRLSGAAFPIGATSFPDQNIWDAGFDASWEIDLFGRVRRNVQAQNAFVAVNQEDMRNIQISLSAEVARAYFELRGAQEQLSVATKNAANQQRTLQVTRQRLEAGRGTAFDTERALAQLGFTQASIPPLEAQVRQAQYQIAVLVGRPPTSLAAELDGAVALPPLPGAISVE